MRGLGLDLYEQAFRENEIDEEVLPGLTADDLKDLGVALVGHRSRLLDAIAALRTTPPAAVAPAHEECGVAPAAEAERRQLTVMFCDLSARRRCRPALIPRICARRSAPIRTPFLASGDRSHALRARTAARRRDNLLG